MSAYSRDSTPYIEIENKVTLLPTTEAQSVWGSIYLNDSICARRRLTTLYIYTVKRYRYRTRY